MPLTPHGPGVPPGGRPLPSQPAMALLLGGLVFVGGLVVLGSGRDLWGGLLASGFGAMLLAFGGLMSSRIVSPGLNRLLLVVGLLAGALAFGSAVMLSR